MKGRRLSIILAATAVVAIIVFEVALFVRHGSADGTAHAATTRSAAKTERATEPGAVPPQAVAAVQLLVSARGRSALTSELNASLPPGQMFPAGTMFAIEQGSWHQAGAYANVSGTLKMPGHAPEPAEVGLVHRNGRWLVTFEAAQ
jgi:hypothetical protein